MTRPAIEVQEIGKQFQIGLREQAGQTFREAMVDMALAPFRRLRELSGHTHEQNSFWALRNISFDVPQGQVLGIIGHNGAGKSTLLKILCRITEPTEGRALVYGRVASLLEVGTGFHQELTGRENVYLNGAILGMSKAEIDRNFDEIVEFSGVEKFLDTPIKRYSSGMKVRLAFAVAAYLEPEILIIDEVLAVGDQEFQNKCLGKMHDVATSGRTVLFVSHNMAAVEVLCDRCLFLSHGSLQSQGPTEQIIAEYMAVTSRVMYDVDLTTHSGRIAGATPLFQRLRFVDTAGQVVPHLGLGQPVTIELDLASTRRVPAVVVGVHISNMLGQRVVTYHTHYQLPGSLELDGPLQLRCEIPEIRLMPGTYTVVVALASGGAEFDRIDPAGQIEVVPRDVYATGRIPLPKDGVFVPRAKWTVDADGPAALPRADAALSSVGGT
jgi:lipopolysaccharide transport system ATP-binding protein